MISLCWIHKQLCAQNILVFVDAGFSNSTRYTSIYIGSLADFIERFKSIENIVWFQVQSRLFKNECYHCQPSRLALFIIAIVSMLSVRRTKYAELNSFCPESCENFNWISISTAIHRIAFDPIRMHKTDHQKHDCANGIWVIFYIFYQMLLNY